MVLHAESRGADGAPTAVVIHSDGLTGAETLDIFGLALPGFRVLAPDRTNYGLSPPSSPGGAGRSQGGVAEVALVADDAAEIGALLDGGGHLLGYSYGGVVALAIAAARPDRVRSLTLLEPPAFQLTDDPRAVATRDRIEAAIAGPFDDPLAYWSAFMTGAFGDPPPIPPEAIPEDRQIASMREEVPWDVPLDLGPIRSASIPTLVIAGGWDPGFLAVAEHLASELDGRLVTYPDANHFFMAEGPSIAAEVEAHWSASAP
jgi:pimeloyl-ACP methyl ester carboxylesterase